MLSHWFIGFYTCFVALVFYFISGSNHQHRAQTSPFGCIHCSPKHRGLKEVKHHEPSHKNKLKKSQNSSTRPEQARAKVARAVLLESEAENYISEVRSTVGSSRAKCIQTSKASDHQQYSIQQYITSTRLARWLGSSEAKFHILSNF